MKHVDKNEKMKFCHFTQCSVFEIIDFLVPFFFRDYLMPGTKVGVKLYVVIILFIAVELITNKLLFHLRVKITPSHLSFGIKICYRYMFLWRFIVLRKSVCTNSIVCLSQHDPISSVMVTGLVRAFWQSVRN